MEVRLAVNGDRAEPGSGIAATAGVVGQWYDWGKCQSRLNRLFTGLQAA
jgi:hypothetical protein